MMTDPTPEGMMTDPTPEGMTAVRTTPVATLGSHKIPSHCTEQIADLYAMGTLDAIVELVEAVHQDMRDNPDQYRRLSADQARAIRRFSRVGTEEDWPDTAERLGIYSALLGTPDAALQGANSSNEFHDATANLRDAAKSYSERSEHSVEDMMLARVKDAVVRLREYLSRLCGAALEVGREDIGKIFKKATEILTFGEMAEVFNAQNITDPDWPRGGPHGSDLVTNVSTALAPKLSDDAMRKLREKFTTLQETAQFGSTTIKLGLVDDWETDDKLQKLISNAYRWHNALERYRG